VAQSTNLRSVADLKQQYEEKLQSSEKINAGKIKAVQEVLTA